MKVGRWFNISETLFVCRGARSNECAGVSIRGKTLTSVLRCREKEKVVRDLSNLFGVPRVHYRVVVCNIHPSIIRCLLVCPILSNLNSNTVID